MKPTPFSSAFLLGAAAVVWIAAGYVASNPLALVITLAIGAVYVVGALELREFRRATASLSHALGSIPCDLANLNDWLGRIHAALQTPVRLRVEGERHGLPAPVLTPYLVGLLVMLGMLGTFLGMVVTLNGAVLALEGTTDLLAIRSALAAPVKGLGLAFGTSVAGVATSAMLGLMSALSRRERLQAAQVLDQAINGELCRFSLAHQRQSTYQAIQSQAGMLPLLVEQMQGLITQLQQSNQQLDQRVLSNQTTFHDQARATYTELARSVDASLRVSLGEAARLAGESLRPVVAEAMAGVARESQQAHERLVVDTGKQFDRLTERFTASAEGVANTWASALANHEHRSESLYQELGGTLKTVAMASEQGSAALLGQIEASHARLMTTHASADRERMEAWARSLDDTRSKIESGWQQSATTVLVQQQAILKALENTAQEVSQQVQERTRETLHAATQLLERSETLVSSRLASDAEWAQQHNARMDQIAGQLREELGALRDEEAKRGEAATARLSELQGVVAAHLATLGTALEAPISRLIETASAAPRAAADVIAQLRQEVSASVARDNSLLDERQRILTTLNTLLDAINHAAAEQRSVIDSLVASSAQALEQAGERLAEQTRSETERLGDIATHLNSGAIEVAALGDAFGAAVRAFSDSNDKTVDNLQRIEAALERAQTRGDDQLAYYIAQAREIIDLSLMAQKQAVDEARQPTKPARLAPEVAG